MSATRSTPSGWAGVGYASGRVTTDAVIDKVGAAGGIAPFIYDTSFIAPRIDTRREVPAPVHTPRSSQRAPVPISNAGDAAGGRSHIKQREAMGLSWKSKVGFGATAGAVGALALAGGVASMQSSQQAEALWVNEAATRGPRVVATSAAKAAPFVQGYAADGIEGGDVDYALDTLQYPKGLGLRKRLGSPGAIETAGGVGGFTHARPLPPPSLAIVLGPIDQLTARLELTPYELGGISPRIQAKATKISRFRSNTDKIDQSIGLFVTDTARAAIEAGGGRPKRLSERYENPGEIVSLGGISRFHGSGPPSAPPIAPRGGAMLNLLRDIAAEDAAVETSVTARAAARAASAAAGHSAREERMTVARATAEAVALLPPASPLAALIHQDYPASATMAANVHRKINAHVHGTAAMAMLAKSLEIGSGAGSTSAPESDAALAALRARVRAALPAPRGSAEVFFRHRLRMRDGDADGVVRADEVLALFSDVAGSHFGGGIVSAGRDVGFLLAHLAAQGGGGGARGT